MKTSFFRKIPLLMLVGVLRGYQLGISPFLGKNCRFYPSCSAYAREVLVSEGIWRGGWLTLWRLMRCHPFHPGGIDLPPGRAGAQKTACHKTACYKAACHQADCEKEASERQHG